MKGKIFNAQEVQAILNGSKVMFREVIKPQPWHVVINADFKKGNNIPKYGHDEKEIKCPYEVGQKIFCKEVFCKSMFGKAIYKDEEKEIRSFGGKEVVVKWKPAQHMKQEHSRLTLQIKSIGVERLADITPFDCVCEGVWDGRNFALGMNGKAAEAFKFEWNATHKKPEEKFEASPFVWVVSFEVINN